MMKRWKHLKIYRDEGQADVKDIEAFEKKYNICLPKTFKELMLKHNGVSFEEDFFDFINSREQEDGREFSFDAFRGGVQKQIV